MGNVMYVLIYVFLNVGVTLLPPILRYVVIIIGLLPQCTLHFKK